MDGVITMAFTIRPNHGTEIPSSHIFFDTETISDGTLETLKTESLRLRLGCAKYVRLEKGQQTRVKEMSFETVEPFWQFVEDCQSEERPLWVWAHNLPFDLNIARFWQQLEDNAYEVGIVPASRFVGRLKRKSDFAGFMCLSGQPTIIKALGRRGVVTFLDLFNYLPMTLAQIGESLNFPKGKWPGNDTDDDTLREYCRNDVNVLAEAVIRLLTTWEKEDCGIWKPTASMLAMTSFRHLAKRTEDNKCYYAITPVREPEADLLERESYFGGWVECFYKGRVVKENQKKVRTENGTYLDCEQLPRGPIYQLDVQSCYPYVMRQQLFPTYRTHFWSFCSLSKFGALAASGNAIARVLLDSPDVLFPVRHQGVIHYVRGRFWTTLAGPELKRAFDGGFIREIRETARYELAPIFDEFVDYWWGRKLRATESGDKFDLVFSKMILNSLSGKWGQGGKHWKDCPLVTSPQDWGEFSRQFERDGPRYLLRAVAGNSQIQVDGKIPEWGMPCISAFITSYAREYMRKIIGICPPNSIFHVATDAILCDQRAYTALLDADMIQSSVMGKLALEAIYDDGDFRGQNSYRVGKRIVHAGNWGKAKEVEKDRWAYDSWQTLATTLQTRPDGSVKIERIGIEQEQPTSKGIFQASGWSVPYTLCEAPVAWEPLTNPEGRWPNKLWEEPTIDPKVVSRRSHKGRSVPS